MNEVEDKKWNEWPFSFPPVNTLALAEFDTARDEWCRCYIVSHGMDEYGCYCQFQWWDGPRINQTAYYYTPESFRPLLPIENKEQKDSPKEEKSLDNLLKELHNLKQEHNENLKKYRMSFVKMGKVLKEINELVESIGVEIIIK